MKAKRDDWRAGQPTPDPARLWFIDETWAAANMARAYGRAPVGERLVCPAPHGHWETTTFVAALALGGMAAPRVIDGALTGDLFEAYVRQILVPVLRPGDIVVVGNLACHKRPGARRAIEGPGPRSGSGPRTHPT